MIGLFQEHGPCRITNDSSNVVSNPYSWNNDAHVLYIEKPVGVGFSCSTLAVGTSQQAAADVWTFLQIFFTDARSINPTISLSGQNPTSYPSRSSQMDPDWSHNMKLWRTLWTHIFCVSPKDVIYGDPYLTLPLL